MRYHELEETYGSDLRCREVWYRRYCFLNVESGCLTSHDVAALMQLCFTRDTSNVLTHIFNKHSTGKRNGYPRFPLPVPWSGGKRARRNRDEPTYGNLKRQ